MILSGLTDQMENRNSYSSLVGSAEGKSPLAQRRSRVVCGIIEGEYEVLWTTLLWLMIRNTVVFL
jgi:hypothetical protein